MSDFEEKRLASNAYNRAQASRYESLANQYQKAYDKKKAEIEKLESARKELSKQIQSYSEFRNTVSLQLFLQIPLKGQDVIHLIRLYRKLRRR